MLKLNKEAYTKLIKQDIIYLDIYAKPSPERDHIKNVLLNSITLLYDKEALIDDTPIWGLDDVI
jgi:hypothetical protein